MANKRVRSVIPLKRFMSPEVFSECQGIALSPYPNLFYICQTTDKLTICLLINDCCRLCIMPNSFMR